MFMILKSFFTGNLVGKDAYGNSYYIEKKWFSRTQPCRRWVLYNGRVEASKIPPEWHAWLHYATEEIPSKTRSAYPWQKPHQPNLTGTQKAYSPLLQKTSPLYYEAWNPTEQKGQKNE